MGQPDERKLRLGEILINNGTITKEQLNAALNTLRTSGSLLGEVLLSLAVITEPQLVQALCRQADVPYMSLIDYPISFDEVPLINREWAEKFNVLVLGREQDRLIVAMANPLDYEAQEALRLLSGSEISVIGANSEDIAHAIRGSYPTAQATEPPADVSDFSSENILNNLLAAAISKGTADIHIEPGDEEARVRLRIDGDLRELLTLPPASFAELTKHIQKIAHLSDGSARNGQTRLFHSDRPIDIQVSFLPTCSGDKIVLRLLDRAQNPTTVGGLGFGDREERLIRQLLSSTDGLIVVAGPARSGKTTTLYAALDLLNNPMRNITTLENAVERLLPGVNQVQTGQLAPAERDTLLHALPHQDTDILMLEDLGSGPAARYAFDAASSGRLVLSSCYSPDSVSALLHLLHLGFPASLLGEGLRGIIAQRLVKIICPYCKTSYPAGRDEAELLGIEPGTVLYRGQGCGRCGHTGYQGRRGIAEVLPLTEGLKKALTLSTSAENLRLAAERSGMVPLADTCRQLVLQGTTSFQECARVRVLPSPLELQDS